jgi:hypothetical protein
MEHDRKLSFYWFAPEWLSMGKLRMADEESLISVGDIALPLSSAFTSSNAPYLR